MKKSIFLTYLLIGLIFLGGCQSNPSKNNTPELPRVVKYKNGSGFFARFPEKGCVFITAHHVDKEIHAGKKNILWEDTQRDIVIKKAQEGRCQIWAEIKKMEVGEEVLLSGFPKGYRKKKNPLVNTGIVVGQKLIHYDSYQLPAYEVKTSRKQWAGGNSGGLVCLPEGEDCIAVGVIVARSNTEKGVIYFSPFNPKHFMPRMAQK